MSDVKRFEYDWAGRPLVIEIGEVAKQANGACLVQYGESTVLSAAGRKLSSQADTENGVYSAPHSGMR